jgi:GAF domain-containing protein
MAIDDQTVPTGHDPQWVVELQGVLLTTDGLESFLDELASLTVRALPAAAACGVTLQPNGRARTVAANNVLATQVDEIQYGVDDGPCLDAMRTGSVNYVPDLGRETRWPQFCTAALGYGVRGVLSTPLRVLDRSVGALNLYSTTADAFDAPARAQASGFAGHASGAVALALRIARQVEISEDLRMALSTRAIIDQAVGIVMAQQRCTPDGAFAVLRRASQQRNVKVHAIAARIVEGISGRPPRPGQFTPRISPTAGRVESGHESTAATSTDEVS